jgi:hypothetical protein
LSFARACLEKSDEWFRRLIFTDETYVQVKFGENGCWVLPGEQKPKRMTVKHPAKRMLWAGIGFLGDRRITELFWYAGGSTQDGPLYVETLRACLQPLCVGIEPRPILVHDGARTHTGRIASEYIAEVTEFEVLAGWPPSSPDLNPIENFWAWLAGQLTKKDPMARTVDELMDHVLCIARSDAARTVIESLQLSFRRRLKLCVDKKGDHIGY